MARTGYLDTVKNCGIVGPKCQAVDFDIRLFFHKLGSFGSIGCELKLQVRHSHSFDW